MIDIQKAPIKDLLGMAIRSEIDSNRVYSDLVQRVTNPLLKEKFQFLAYEESKHKQILEKLVDILCVDDKPRIPENVDEQLLPSIQFTSSTGLADILYQATKAEQAAEEFYIRTAEKVSGLPQKMLTYLSKIEHSHFLTLKNEYALAQDFADYGEQDIDKIIT